jgi:diaminopimelate epimerase
MLHQIDFTKSSGAGNDFILIDNMGSNLEIDRSRAAAVLCSRHFGIGADGLIFLEPSSKADFIMRYYNADGSYGGMCGNGGRCAARFASLSGIAGTVLSFEALGHLYKAEILETGVKLWMKDPTDFRSDLLLTAGSSSFKAHFVNTGAPHLVVFDDDLERVDVETVGRQIRNLDRFAPEGANVNFARILASDRIQIRTYERGVEHETLACGTGSVACAIIASQQYQIQTPIRVKVKSDEELVVDFERSPQYRDVTLEGSAHILFTGRLMYNDILCRIEDKGDSGTASGKT